MYSLTRKLLFRFSPELAHEFSMDMLGAAERLKILKLFVKPINSEPVEVMGLKFPNMLGLAAGFDKNGDYLDALGQLGFGFIELGTVTPKPQIGNPKPRLFRIPEQQAIINRMGFNNKGIDHLIANLRGKNYSGIIGINIGKNKDTPLEKAADDYRICLTKAYPWADYIAVNLSSPNTPDLRKLQFGDTLKNLVTLLKKEQSRLNKEHGRYVPLVVKIDPDLSDSEINNIAKTLIEAKIDGVIATNTTINHDTVKGLPHAEEQGGLSGAPLTYVATQKIKKLAQALDKKIPIIGVGGIFTPEDAQAKIQAGASLVQIYTGFIYQGPRIIAKIVKALNFARAQNKLPAPSKTTAKAAKPKLQTDDAKLATKERSDGQKKTVNQEFTEKKTELDTGKFTQESKRKAGNMRKSDGKNSTSAITAKKKKDDLTLDKSSSENTTETSPSADADSVVRSKKTISNNRSSNSISTKKTSTSEEKS